MISKVQPDNQKSEALQKMAKITLERLDETNTQKYPSNTLVDYYDAIHKLMEACALKMGIKIKGEGAHQELIDYVSKQFKFSEHTRIFLQQMRDYRNRISYEGFMINKNYIELNEKRIKDIIGRLFSLIKN